MSNADLFVAKLNRLKTALGVSKDKEAGDFLGLKEQAFNARKSRGSFPEKELRALAQQRPELGIDVEHVLTGGELTAHQRQAQERAYAVTQAPNASAEDRARLLGMLDGAGTAMAATNASRARTYADIKDVLAICSDHTLELALMLVVKLYRAELAEKDALKGPWTCCTRRPEST